MKEAVKQSSRTRDMVYIALFTALTAVMSQIKIPMPSGVPITLQTLAAALTGYMLGRRRGAIALALYMLIGAVGLPVFTGFTGGLASVTGVTGGFIWGFIPMAYLCGIGKGGTVVQILTGLLGLICCHICGILQWWAIKGGGFLSSFLTVSAPYLIKDTVSVVAAYFIAVAVKKRVPFKI